MNVTDAICRDVIDTGIGFINFQKVELEHLRGETVFLRIDQLAGLGCCCFCSIQFIIPERMLQQPEVIEGFLRATQRGAALTRERPEEAWELLCQANPQLRTPMYRTIFTRSLPFFSGNLLNVERDWKKVESYTRRLKVIDKDFDIAQCYTNRFLPAAPYSDLKPVGCPLETEAS